MASPKLVLLVTAQGRGLGSGSRRHVPLEAPRIPALPLGARGAPVWRFSTRAAQGRQDVWPSGTWEPGGDANLAGWLHAAPADAPEQSQSMKHTLVLGAGTAPARGDETQPRVWSGFALQPRSISEAPAAPDLTGVGATQRGGVSAEAGGVGAPERRRDQVRTQLSRGSLTGPWPVSPV